MQHDDGTCLFPEFGNGKDGNLTIQSRQFLNTNMTSISGTGGSNILVFHSLSSLQPGDRVLLHQTSGRDSGHWEENQILSLIDAKRARLSWTMKKNYRTDDANKAQAIRIPQFKTVLIEKNGTLLAPPWNGTTGGILTFFATDSIRVVQGGKITMSGFGFRSTPLQTQTEKTGKQGEGVSGQGNTNSSENETGGGGGEFSACYCCSAGSGGGGGHALEGQTGSIGEKPGQCQSGGKGGQSISQILPATLFYGGAGGSGGASQNGHNASGGNGGGLVLMGSPTINILGNVHSNGNNGSPPANLLNCGAGAGGGGAGGTIYLRAKTVNLGQGLVMAQGGKGGDDPNKTCKSKGGNGSQGTVFIKANPTIGQSNPSWISTEQPHDGSIPSRAAENCLDLQKNFPTFSDQEYWIKPPSSAKAFKTYCLMSQEGGGWTLVMKIDGSVNPSLFSYSSPLWTEQRTYLEQNTNFDLKQAKLHSFSTVPFTQLLFGIRNPIAMSSSPRYLIATKTATSLQSLMNKKNDNPFANKIGQTKWKNWIGNGNLQPNCNLEGFNLQPKWPNHYLNLRIGIFGNNENDCGSPDSFIGFGAPSSSQCNGGKSTSAGNIFCPGARTNVGFGYIFVR